MFSTRARSSIGLNSSCTNRRPGIVLPVVLVMLVVMTTVVLFMIRRGTIDERLAGNMRGVVTMDTAAQYALRWCELWVWESPPGVASLPGRKVTPRSMPAPASTATAAWKYQGSPDYWSQFAVTLPAIPLPNTDQANPSTAACLIEDASAELQTDLQYNDGNGMPSDLAWRKFRLTVEVSQPGAIANVARAQSEIRMYLN